MVPQRFIAQADIDHVRAVLEKNDDLTDIKYISKEEGLEQFREDMGQYYILKKLHQLIRPLGVEISRRLVHYKQPRVVGKRTGYRHTLLLASEVES